MTTSAEIVQVSFNTWRLERELSVETCGYQLTVPAGFVSDGASIPRLLWPVIAPFELSVTAPFVHDWIYANQGRVGTLTRTLTLTRADADRVLYDLMKQDNVWWWRRWLAFRAVRLFGASHWSSR